MKYIVMFSGGLTSFEAARRAIAKHGRDAVELWFADTGTEDDDLHRFCADVESLLRVLVRTVRMPGHTGDVWDLFDAQGMIGNTRADLCSRMLKREPLRNLLETEHTPETATLVIGMDWIEDCDRIKRARRAQAPFAVWFPLIDEPFVTKTEIAAWLQERGIAQPRLYDLGARHNNCGGFCVKAGIGQFAWLHRTMPDRYAYHEQREREFRQRTGKDVAILRDRRGGSTRPLTLERLRERIESGERFAMPTYARGSCACFVQPDLFDA